MATTRALNQPPRRGRIRWRQHLRGYAFISPWIVGFLIFSAYPVFYSAFLAFTNYDLLSPPEFAGSRNFTKMAGDRLFYTALGNTAYFTFISVPIQLAVALGMALVAQSANCAGSTSSGRLFTFQPSSPRSPA